MHPNESDLELVGSVDYKVACPFCGSTGKELFMTCDACFGAGYRKEPANVYYKASTDTYFGRENGGGYIELDKSTVDTLKQQMPKKRWWHGLF